MTSTISEIESAYLATKQGAENPGLAPDSCGCAQSTAGCDLKRVDPYQRRTGERMAA